ncbi:MFS transporter [Methanoplanus limicola]|uniref:Major facilitator superfamily MFS_1 n=1 Tax=Methanoplanus limicola DSM 2279 TaxID=937775 RepID=H1Z0P7_9EURY|nr:MFS transporter [Methanoplanus limicola]EHQ35304.1 major facilitator superfamily MFS_1 [Methanoplanus limicola DSM 2279]
MNCEQRTINRNIILLVASLGSFLTPFMGSSINIAIPEIGAEFLSDAVLLSWVPTAYLLASAIMIVPMGRLADIRGRTKIFLAGIVIYTLGSLLSTMVPSIEVLIMFRVLQGIGGAMIFGTSVAIVTSVFPANLRGRALGINVAFVYSGLAVGPVVGGILTEFFGWRSIFYANVAIGLFIFIAGLKYLKINEITEKKTRFDYQGSLLYAVTIFFVMLGFQELSEPQGLLLMLAGVFTGAFFFIWEKRTEHPVFNITLLTENRVFALSSLAAFINYSATFAIGFLLSIYLQMIKGFSPLNAGLILIAQPVMQVILSPSAGKLSDRIESRIPATAGMAMITAGLLLFSFLTDETPVIIIIANLAFLGIGYALFSSPNTHAVMSSVSERYYGVASGMLGTTRLCGMMASMGISMMIFAIIMQEIPLAEVPPGMITESVNLAFMVFVILCAIGTVASYIRNPKKPD